ncbi:MAG TPA: DUF3556 domain-containing protein [Candidatus Limnocylindria bacterium]|nr:DUF3556 domain-containing protein [Candidatus Limnocylindria bacterium]
MDRPGPLLEWLRRDDRASAVVGQTIHRQPSIIFYTGYLPLHVRLIDQLVAMLPDPDALDDLVDMTTLRWILVRPASEWPSVEAREQALEAFARLRHHVATRTVSAFAARRAGRALPLARMGGRPGCGAPPGVLRAIEPAMLLPLVVFVPMLAASDKTVFLAMRGEHYYTALVCVAHLALAGGVWIAGCKAVWVAIWFWAATSKLNRHFPTVICGMLTDSPFVPVWRRCRLYRGYPDDLRPSHLATGSRTPARPSSTQFRCSCSPPPAARSRRMRWPS